MYMENNITPSFLADNILTSNIKYRNKGINDCGEYDITRGYRIGDMVRVRPDVKYVYPGVGHGISPKIGWENENNSKIGYYDYVSTNYTYNNTVYNVISLNTIPIPGTWICVATVPSWNFIIQMVDIGKLNDLKTVLLNNSPKDSWIITSYYLKGTLDYNKYERYLKFCRLFDVDYLPRFPEHHSVANFDLNDFTPQSVPKVDGKYWELISLPPKLNKICIDGDKKQIYYDSFSTAIYDTYDQITRI